MKNIAYRFSGRVAVILCLVTFLLSVAFAQEDKPYAGTTLNVAAVKFSDVEIPLQYAQEVAEEMGIDLNIAWFTFDGIQNKIVLDYTAGARTWDIVYMNTRWIGELAKIGAIVPIEDFAKNQDIADPSLLSLNDFIPQFEVAATYEDKFWTIPNDFSMVVLAYREDLFNHPTEQENFRSEYGYELAPTQTYEQFRDVAEFFTRKAGEELAGEVLENDFYGTSHSFKKGGFLWNDYLAYLYAFGGEIFNPETMMPAWNSPESIAAANYVKSLLPFMPPNVLVMSSGESTSWFADGQVAMIPEFIGRVTDVASNTESSKVAGKVGISVLPSKEGAPEERQHATLVVPNSIGIFGNSQHKEAAYKLLEKLFSHDVQLRMAMETSWLPTRTDVISDPELVAAKPYLASATELLETPMFVYTDPKIPEYPRIEDIGGSSIGDILAGTKTTEVALNEAQEELVALFKEAGYIK